MPGMAVTAFNAYCRVFSCSRAALLVTFLVLWMVAEILQRNEERQSQAHPDSLDSAAIDFAKSVFSLSAWFVRVCRQLQGVHSLSTISRAVPFRASPETQPELPTHNVPFHAAGQGFSISESGPDCRETTPPVSPRHPRSSIVNLTLGSVRSNLSIFLVALAYILRAYTNPRAREFIDPFTLYLAFPVTVLGILFILRIASWRNFPSAFWHACVLQFAGFFITRDALVGSVLPDCGPLISFALCNSIWISLVDLIYGLHRSSSVHLINTIIFAQSALVHSLLFISHTSHAISHLYYNRLASALQVLPLIEAAKDIVSILIIHQYGALTQGVLISLASTCSITFDTWGFIEAPYSAFLGCLIAILGFGVFAFCGEQRTTEQPHDLSVSIRRCFAAIMISLAALGYIVIVITQESGINSSNLSSMWGQSSRNRSNCRVPESSARIPAQTIANYTHFSNVLLIVFFSHARYDANLDFHREVYADYFPNIVYIGPASREDKGFAHSYDVLVDSFQSDEDLSDPIYYRMSGRMAHHMLYTALREYSCYDGYLWAPFDTLLNVPRLQQFNQSLFWYHSPWGQLVPNPALGKHTGPVLNSSRHAPPAMISPDTSINLTETWRGWGPDWWWGDPHVGVSVCMDAFNKVPEDMRARLAERTSGQTRFIGGSADTLYIPGRHRKAFMDVLALFLETNCFLEIATPTTVHLVVPPGEPIQFVDHWWIYQPPFNASFVRQKWAEGYEVDTFHTFHWGERGEDGIWRGDHRHVADVRHLQWESANRQGLGGVFPVNPSADARPL